MSALNKLAVKENQEQTMTSLELMDIVNKSRIDAGETPHEPRKFLAKVEDEIDDLTGKKIRLNNNQTKTVYYDLTRDQCTLVGMRESKAVRRNVLAKLKELQSPVKQITYQEALRQLANEIDAKEQALLERNIAIATKAEIGERREATAMNTASQAVKQRNALQIELDQSQQWSTIKRMEIITGLKFNWRTMKSAGQDLGITPKEVFDPNFGTVKSYHADVWKEAFALGIDGNPA